MRNAEAPLGWRFFMRPKGSIPDTSRLFVVRHTNGEILHIEVTHHPAADWTGQQILECCAWDRAPPRSLIHDRDSRYGVSFDRRMWHLGVGQVRTPFRSPRANAIAERRVRSARSECLDHIFVFSEGNLVEFCRGTLQRRRPHLSLDQKAACGPTISVPENAYRKVVADPVLGGLHHIYKVAT
jgi:putative transposase